MMNTSVSIFAIILILTNAYVSNRTECTNRFVKYDITRFKKQINYEEYENGKKGKRFKVIFPRLKFEVDNKNVLNNSIDILDDLIPQKSNQNKVTSPIINRLDGGNIPMVSTSEGIVKGTIIEKNDLMYYVFRSIPYAEPPIRFQPPKPPKPWKGTRDATKESELCFQKEEIFKTIGGSEDCLYLNINTPTLQDKKLPVLFFIYGGMFKFGTASNSYYGPEKFIQQNIIVVSVYYRVGAFGFLSTNSKHAPGNVGLKDIVMALRWIRKNIHMFGGNPYNICLYGVSSGSAVVEYLSLSPLAKGLFDKAIAQSGSVLNSGMLVSNPVENAFKLGRYLGQRTRNVEDLINFLSQTNATNIIMAEEKMDLDELSPLRLNFGPTVEKYITSDSFLIDDPEEILNSGLYNHVPFWFGFNSKEGTQFIQNEANVTSFIRYFEESFVNIIYDIVLEGVHFGTEKKLIENIRQFYFQNKPISKETFPNMLDMLGDIAFLYGIQKSLHIRTQHLKAPLYYFKFSYFDEDIRMLKNHDRNITGAGHAENLFYTFCLPSEVLTKEKSKKVSKIMIELISNFAKYGNPIPKTNDLLPIMWPSISNYKTLECLELTDSINVITNPYDERYQFWKKFYLFKDQSIRK